MGEIGVGLARGFGAELVEARVPETGGGWEKKFGTEGAAETLGAEDGTKGVAVGAKENAGVAFGS